MTRERSKNQQESQNIEPRRQGHISKMEPGSAFSPFSMMRRFADEMDRVFEGTMDRWGRPWLGAEHFSPQIDMFERDGKLVISADLPGLSKDDVKIDITEDAIVIEGQRKYEHEERAEGVYRSERSYGQFRRQVSLPEGVKTDTATAKFNNGVLEITVDAPQPTKNSRRLEIQGSDTGSKPGQTAA